ncbi:MAG TPA: helix-turn-helix domain-containing protein [Solirubrobacterales bacterium]|nr:helix-turn-helix domain-containing protein [Solirubrobacterales bacterium]
MPSLLVEQDAVEIGLRVLQARKRLGRDQEEIALFANVSPRTVFAIEKGKPTVRFDMLARVLAAVGLKLSVEGRDKVWTPRSDELR